MGHTLVMALDRGNYGYVMGGDDVIAEVFFKNPDTGATALVPIHWDDLRVIRPPSEVPVPNGPSPKKKDFSVAQLPRKSSAMRAAVHALNAANNLTPNQRKAARKAGVPVKDTPRVRRDDEVVTDANDFLRRQDVVRFDQMSYDDWAQIR